jgi:hypothetical protein
VGVVGVPADALPFVPMSPGLSSPRLPRFSSGVVYAVEGAAPVLLVTLLVLVLGVSEFSKRSCQYEGEIQGGRNPYQKTHTTRHCLHQ